MVVSLMVKILIGFLLMVVIIMLVSLMVGILMGVLVMVVTIMLVLLMLPRRSMTTSRAQCPAWPRCGGWWLAT